MNNYIITYNVDLPSEFEQKEVSLIKNTSFLAGKLLLDRESPHFPARSDLKIMRDDIVVSIIAIKNIFQKLDYSKEEIKEISLLVANGAFVDKPEKHLNRIPQIYKMFTPEMTEEEKKHKLYRMTPPLLALETLTNSSMSFIAQYTGMKNQNTTFGNTSISTHYALSQAIIELRKNATKKVLVCSANCGDIYSFLTNSSIVGYADGWKESAAVGSLVVIAAKTTPENAKCKITKIKVNKKIPNLETTHFERGWSEILPTEKADMLIFSGAFSKVENELDEVYCKKLNKNIFSFFKEYGNLGAANISIGISKGIEILSDTIKSVDIVDRDIYGRESMVRIEKC